MTTLTCRIPQRWGFPNVAAGLDQLALPFTALERADEVILDFSGAEFCDPFGTVVLGAFGAHYFRRTKRRVTLAGWQPDSYLSRVELKKLWGYDDDWPKRRHVTNNMMSVVEVAVAKDRIEASNHVLKILGLTHPDVRDAIFYLLEEILRNVEEHADSPVNALLQAQFYEKRNEVVFAIADTGVGILHNL